jgi:hypothetical protein
MCIANISSTSSAPLKDFSELISQARRQSDWAMVGLTRITWAIRQQDMTYKKCQLRLNMEATLAPRYRHANSCGFIKDQQ